MAEEKNKTAKTSKKNGGLIKFLKETVIELKKVVWPTKKQLAVYTVVVIIACIIMAFLVTGFDTIMNFISDKFLLKL